jgi:hypothetical protein
VDADADAVCCQRLANSLLVGGNGVVQALFVDGESEELRR